MGKARISKLQVEAYTTQRIEKNFRCSKLKDVHLEALVSFVL